MRLVWMHLQFLSKVFPILKNPYDASFQRSVTNLLQKEHLLWVPTRDLLWVSWETVVSNPLSPLPSSWKPFSGCPPETYCGYFPKNLLQTSWKSAASALRNPFYLRALRKLLKVSPKNRCGLQTWFWHSEKDLCIVKNGLEIFCSSPP